VQKNAKKLPDRYLDWLHRSLVRRTAVRVTMGLLGIISITTLLSFVSTYYLVNEQYRQELELKADNIAEQFENSLNGWHDSISSLARNNVMANALLDSQGRDQYLVPFLREYDLHIDEHLGLTLCDYLGNPIAAAGLGAPNCFHKQVNYATLLENNQPHSFLRTNENRHLELILIFPVTYPITDTAEGALVGRLDLSTWFKNNRHIPPGYRAQLQQNGKSALPTTDGQSLHPPLRNRTPRLVTPMQQFGFQLQIGRQDSPPLASLIALFLIQGSIGLLLIPFGFFYAYRAARRISQPILSLVETARAISDGKQNLRADISRQDEIGQLALDFNRMVDFLEDARQNLETQVAERTAALSVSERRERQRAQELDAMFNAMPALVMYSADPDCRHVQINHALRDLLPHDENHARAALPLQMLEPLGLRHFGTPLALQDWPLVKAAQEGTSVLNFACEIPLADGHVRHFLGNAIPLRQGTQTMGAIAAFIDITLLRQAEEKVAEQEERYRRLFELMPEGLCVHDGERIEMVNSAMAHLAGYERPEELLGQHILSFIHVDDRPTLNLMHQQLASSSAKSRPISMRLIRRDGSFVHVEINATTLLLGDKKCVQSVLHDLTSQREAEEQTRLAARVFEASQDGIFITDHRGLIISVNPAFTRRTGYTITDLLGKDPGILSSGQHDDSFYRDMWQALASEGRWENEIHNRHKNGELLAQWISISALRDDEGAPRHYIAVLSDITESQSTTTHMAYLAQHDYLTGLPNRVLLRDRITQGLSAAARERKKLAVLFIDLDGFKQVNDIYGHAVGDQLLKDVGQRLQAHLRDVDTVSRLGGDEFVVLLRDLSDSTDATLVADKLCQSIAQPYPISSLDISSISASIGVALYPGDGDDIDVLLERADQAMYRAKNGGKNKVVFYAAQLVEAGVDTTALAIPE